MLTGSSDSRRREREERLIREVSNAIFREMERGGHICTKAAAIAKIEANQANANVILAKLCDKVDTLAEEVAMTRGEKKILTAAVGLVAAIVGGLIAKIF